jgi:prophage antirepressor-like protein
MTEPSSGLTPFQFEQHEVRVFMIDGEPWWVLNDVCAAIGIVNPRNAVTRLENEDVSTVHIADGQGGPDRTIINESGLYDLIFVSRKIEAKRFKRWVTKEVLPEIRRTGTYGLVPTDLPTALEQYAKALREKDAASKRAIEAETYALELQPKAIVFDKIMNSDGLCDLGALAQALGGGRTRFVARLRELGILVSEPASQRGGTRPMQRYQELQWFEVKMEMPNAFVGTLPVAYATGRGVTGVFHALVKHGVGEHRWGALPTEEELFARIGMSPEVDE